MDRWMDGWTGGRKGGRNFYEWLSPTPYNIISNEHSADVFDYYVLNPRIHYNVIVLVIIDLNSMRV